MRFVRALAQLLFYLPLMALLGYFSTQPAFTALSPNKSLVRVSFSHAGERKEPCRQRSAEELAKLPPNMRAAQDCPRERSPVTVELDLDGKMLFTANAAPTGLRRDGASTVYRRLVVPSGKHRIVARLRDRPGAAFNYRGATTVDLAAGGTLLIEFNPNQGGFVFRR